MPIKIPTTVFWKHQRTDWNSVERCENPLEAAHRTRAGKRSYFLLPLGMLRHPNALSFSKEGGNPFVRAMLLDSDTRRKFLFNYYRLWKPSTAGEAIIDFQLSSDSMLSHLPPHLFYLTPWSGKSVEECRQVVERWVLSDRREHPPKVKVFSSNIFPIHGPTCNRIIDGELMRLEKAYESLYRKGYDVSQGPVQVTILRSGSELRYMLVSGFHRCAVAEASGLTHIPATFHPSEPALVDDLDVSYWPGVCRGIWSKQDALKYMEHLFSVDDLAWLRRLFHDEIDFIIQRTALSL